MYSTLTFAKNSKATGKIVGTHQLLDKAARTVLDDFLVSKYFFPDIKQILNFEGIRGPDGLKSKSPDNDDPSHMFGENNGEALYALIEDHYYNLVQALKTRNDVRAAFEAAWLAHMLADGLTPAHHFPLSEVRAELAADNHPVSVLGQPIKGLIKGNNMLETLRGNWLYLGAGGYMSQHLAYEMGVASLASALPLRTLTPEVYEEELIEIDLYKTFYRFVEELNPKQIYDRFIVEGWTNELAYSTKNTLLPQIIKLITMIWYAAYAESYEIGNFVKNCDKIKSTEAKRRAHESDRFTSSERYA